MACLHLRHPPFGLHLAVDERCEGRHLSVQLLDLNRVLPPFNLSLQHVYLRFSFPERRSSLVNLLLGFRLGSAELQRRFGKLFFKLRNHVILGRNHQLEAVECGFGFLRGGGAAFDEAGELARHLLPRPLQLRHPLLRPFDLRGCPLALCRLSSSLLLAFLPELKQLALCPLVLLHERLEPPLGLRQLSLLPGIPLLDFLEIHRGLHRYHLLELVGLGLQGVLGLCQALLQLLHPLPEVLGLFGLLHGHPRLALEPLDVLCQTADLGFEIHRLAEPVDRVRGVDKQVEEVQQQLFARGQSQAEGLHARGS
mmetsp:Transcript_12277/g.29165  ORF Transcript_12277/g.29165 Transcript_12277/m.29165 type:complete len:310 (+) Transcript_12277:1072-2001(+)